MGFTAKLLKISSAVCFGIYVMAALAPLRNGQYFIIDGALLLDGRDENGNVSKLGGTQVAAMVLAVALLISGYAADRNHN